MTKKSGKNSSNHLREDSVKFDFGISFQRTILKKSIAEPEWYSLIREYANPDYFDSVELVELSSFISAYYEKHETVPDTEVLKELLKDRKDLLSEIEEIGRISLTNSKAIYAEESMINFSIRQKYKETILNSASALDLGDMEKVKSNFDSALSFAENIEERSEKGIMLLDDLSSFEERYHSKEEEKIPTLFKTLDEKLRGGISKKELGFILAPPYRGKSAALIQLGTNALFSGKNVLHITLELSHRKTSIRYDSCLTGLPYEEIVNNRKLYEKKIHEFKKLHKGKLYIQEFPARSIDTGNIRTFIKKLNRQIGFYPDLLIIDYIDEMRRPNWENVSYAVGDVVSRLRGMSSSLRLATWSASQTNRAGFSKASIDMDDVADSWDKAKVSDIMIALCQIKEEEENNRMRWVIIKNRDNHRFSKPILMSTKFEIMRFKETGIGV